MTRRHSWISLLIAIPGALVCVLAIVGFVWRILTNQLPFHNALSASEHYQAVGHAYGDGFLAGFFFAFFLTLVAFAISALVAQRRKVRALPRGGWTRPVPVPKRSA